MIKNEEKLKMLHQKKEPLILYNCWDVSSARAIQAGGAKAMATSSYAIAENLGVADGEQLTFDEMFQVLSRIAANTQLPLTVDIESGYAENLNKLAKNTERLLEIGIAGINIEDQLMGATNPALCSTEEYCDKIKAIKQTAAKRNANIFINARTDIFFQGRKETEALVNEAIKRTKAYAKAGADSIFIPGLLSPQLICTFVQKSPLPVNVMLMDGMVSTAELTEIGVKRISYGPNSYFQANLAIQQATEKIFGGVENV
ncbi:isocitrate lyase/phosphoenolpyruvate mutase family protein [Listeria ivanovii]|uniref:isocitrate lyase/PEP mutase family protein n=1 Tax=Listeria ivanovii TaxID=1638 RepID=UPI0016266363|nr:isocitrate lyase/phosphoenolpyruvate mutase family protein [Listeria ivanovii]MBC2255513.1 isocitrate lyase/phosphoenolpyruvate mutase family protein [Listeria ivanovii]